MSLCKLLVLDFMELTGQFDEWEEERYNSGDIQFGLEYAEDLIKDRYKTEPFYKFNLKMFVGFCRKKLEAVTARNKKEDAK